LRRVREQSGVWRRLLRIDDGELTDDTSTGQLLALAYPERVGQRRDGGGNRYLLRNGRGAVLDEPGSLGTAPYLVVADLDGKSPDSRIYLAAPLERNDLLSMFTSEIELVDLVTWDQAAGTVTAVQQQRLGSIVLREVDLRYADPDALDTSWPDVANAALASALNQWLRPHLVGLRRRSEVEQLDLYAIVLDMLTWEQRRQLDAVAPPHIVVPSGSRIPVDYSDVTAPSVAVRLQEMFGCAETPRIYSGQVAVTLHLLSPAHRPVQITRDLAGFWRTSYFAVRKNLRGRYPRHEWPLDPLGAAPTTRPKRRSE
jgi:ATP-dependent helicase HrpB